MTYLAEFCAWFQRQQAANRLELLVTLLQMLHPLELRFVGACVEELARKDYYCLRDYEIRSNNGQVVSQLTDLTDSGCRSRLVVALSLLNAGNYATSAVLYNILLNLSSMFDQLPKTKDFIDEIILLLVMAKHHPAFRFDQRADVAELLERFAALNAPEECSTSAALAEEKHINVENEQIRSVVDCATQMEDEVGCCCTCGKMPPIPGGDSTVAPNQPSPIYVANICVNGTRRVDNEDVYDLQVTWSNNEQTETSKTLREMYDFHRQLLDWYPRDAGACGSGRKIPYFPGYRDGSGGEAALSENMSREVSEYVKDLLKLSSEILCSEYTLNFFKTSSIPASPSPKCADSATSPAQAGVPERPCVLDPGSSEEGECIDAEGRVISLTIYNSHVNPAERKAKESPNDPSAVTPVRHENDRPAVSSPALSARMPKKVQKTSKPASHSPSKTSESSSATSQTSLDLVQSMSTISSTSTSSRKYNSKKCSVHPLFIPSPLFQVLKQDGLVDDYKRYMFGRGLEELCGMTECDLIKAGVPLEPCLRIINAAKNYVLATSKHLNGTYLPKLSAVDAVTGDMIFLRPGYRRPTPPLLELRTGSLGSDPGAISAIPAIPYLTVGALSVDTSLSSASGKMGCGTEPVNGPTSVLSASSSVTPQPSESTGRTDTGFGNPGLDPAFSSVQTKHQLMQHSCPDALINTATTTSANDPSLISPAWVQPTSEEDFHPVVRSYSVGSGDTTTTTTTTYVMTVNSTSTSLPPSQSQSPAPSESHSQQQVSSYYPVPMAGGVKSTSDVFPAQGGNGGNTSSHHRSSKGSYHRPYKGNLHQQHPNAIHRRSYAPAFDYSRPQQHLISFIPQSMSAHQMALQTGIPAANFVRAPPPPPGQAASAQRVRIPCQQCNGTSTTCPVCCHSNWTNSLLTTAATGPGGPFLFQLAATPTGHMPQLFSPPFGNSMPAAQYFGPPPNYRLPATTIATSPMVFKSASATLVLGDPNAPDNQQVRRSLTMEPTVAGGQPTCCNCGQQGHWRESCTEPTLDDMTSSGHFHLNLAAKEDSVSSSQDR